MSIYGLYLITGAFGGFLGGLLGLGGGIIFVPLLFFIFNSHDLHTGYVMQSAVSTSSSMRYYFESFGSHQTQ